MLGMLAWVQPLQAVDPSKPGPYAVGSATVAVRRPSGSTFNALLFYPATTGGANAPLDAAHGPYPAISYGHGFLQQPSGSASTLQHLASHGHMVIASTSETGFLPSHSNFAKDIRYTLDYLSARNRNPADAFYGKVNEDRFGLVGYSMGGGAVQLAAAADTRVKAVVGLAAAVTNPSPVPLLPELRTPIALLSGDEDTIVPPDSAMTPMYNAAKAPKLRTLIDGGSHVGFLDEPPLLFSDEGSLPAEKQLALTKTYLASYFGLYLQDDQPMWRTIWGPEAFTQPGMATQGDPGVTLVVDAPAKTGTPQESVRYEVKLTNSGPEANRFTLFGEDNRWDIQLQESRTPALQPGQTYSFFVDVAVPQGTRPGVTDALLLSARSDNDLATRGFTRLTTTAGRLACDFDSDGVLGVGDIDLLAVRLREQTSDLAYDVDRNGRVDDLDLLALVEDSDKLNTFVGDANLDGEFDSSDFVQVFAAGLYEDGGQAKATWASGDWNADARFDSQDLVAAFQRGGYERGPRAAVAAVPEPAGFMGTAFMLAIIGWRRTRRGASRKNGSRAAPPCSSW